MSTQNQQVVLQVGDRRFTASIDVLVERSQYFEALFSGDWLVKTQDDGSIFLDGDGDVFEHVIAYIRRGVFPLAFDPVKGHDHFLYFKVLQEARYFQCPHLITWLEHKCYYKCVFRVYCTKLHEEFIPNAKFESSTTDFTMTAISKIDTNIYVCPRNIAPHRGHPEKCGRQCANARGGNGPTYDIKGGISEWMVTKTTLGSDYGWMADSG